MSKISLASNASGTGIFTIASPNGNTDRTINLPDSNGTILTTATAGVPVNGPAFSATLSGDQSLTGNVTTKLAFAVEGFDTNSNYDTALYRFTPSVAGYYQVNAGVITNGTYLTQVLIYKNGVGVVGAYPVTTQGINLGAIVYMNGSTDYLELYGLLTTTGTVRDLDAFTYFQAFLARSAT